MHRVIGGFFGVLRAVQWARARVPAAEIVADGLQARRLITLAVPGGRARDGRATRPGLGRHRLPRRRPLGLSLPRREIAVPAIERQLRVLPQLANAAAARAGPGLRGLAENDGFPWPFTGAPHPLPGAEVAGARRSRGRNAPDWPGRSARSCGRCTTLRCSRWTALRTTRRPVGTGRHGAARIDAAGADRRAGGRRALARAAVVALSSRRQRRCRLRRRSRSCTATCTSAEILVEGGEASRG